MANVKNVKPGSFIQKWLFEIRFLASAGVFGRAGDIIDRWVSPDSEIEYNHQALRFRTQDPKRQFTVQVTLGNAILEAEGLNDFSSFIKIAQQFTKDVIEILPHVKLYRLGLRYWEIIPGISRESARVMIADNFFLSQDWQDTTGRDSITDLMIVLEFMSDTKTQGRLNFGPYVKDVNLAAFTYNQDKGIKDLDDGLLFDCDFGTTYPVGSEILRPSEVGRWLVESYNVSRERVGRVQNMLIEEK